mmetsp:Transcript_77004/g.135781  ORF Transcript_77004/g.135781 Transcript_77004/m.135781 type:complete len:473 (-) Transcript_77004:124-1542(-)|eukprot:CAMPEP_0197635784 /NCGR_PEP_ID=MMETSP1338-20131121/11502_1 /TAXON_ID=43686 ORGANISM="Pelagodinium beii, Strain RCC1491" /NCGR_SAMPLE_ID=MMETSP1338 /ASSEMBLY_ACC=CAM_ASM_000754 /LENGTH=472 /DNA_ID=CAMNT_0043207909 /DNA_START=90 /DNA_END=1508 /DNA_ORIENTATION=-
MQLQQFSGRTKMKGWLPPGLISERNVKLSFGFSVLGALAGTIAHGHIFTVYIFELYGDNSSVGFFESVPGVTSLITALPVGMAVDKLPRTRLLKGCAAVGLLAAALGALAVGLGPQAVRGPLGEKVPPSRAFSCLLLLAMALWGFFYNTATSAALALFADSVPQGRLRRELYATKSTITLLSLSVGPLLALLGSRWFGNSWQLEQMAGVLLPGFAVMIPLCCLLFYFEEIGESTSDTQVPLLSEVGGPKRSSQDVEAQTHREEFLAKSRSKAAWAVPLLLLLGELTTSVGAGMTVKFFGLWFKNDFGFTPSGLASLQAATPVAIAAAVQLLQAQVKRSPYGPIPVVLGFWMLSVILLLMMTQVRDWRVLVLMHLLRMAFANCKEPVTRAILADFVPSEKRGRWNAVHSLTGMTWNLSAGLGGLLCDRHGYGRTFAFTACLYVCAMLFWLPLIKLVPQRESLAETDDDRKKGS